MSDIDKVLDGFKSETLSYNDFIKLMGVDNSATVFLAYVELKDIPNIKAMDILRVVKKYSEPSTNVITETYIRENLGESQDPAIVVFCNEFPTDKVCGCINNTLLELNRLQKQNEEYTYEKNIIDMGNKIKEWIYKYYIKYYDDVLGPAEKKRLDDFRQDNGKQSTSLSPPSYDETMFDQEQPESGYRACCPPWAWTQFRLKYNGAYKLKALTAHKESYLSSLKLTKDAFPPPVPVEINTNCCTNVVNVGPGATAVDIAQGCDQKIVSAKNMKDLEERSLREKEEEAAKKIQEEAAKKIQDAEDKKKQEEKKKMIIIIAIVVCVLLSVGGIVFFLISRGAAVSTGPATPQSVNSTP